MRGKRRQRDKAESGLSDGAQPRGWLVAAATAVLLLVVQYLLQAPFRRSHRAAPPISAPAPPADRPVRLNRDDLALALKALVALAMVIGAIAALITAIEAGSEGRPAVPTVICRHVTNCARPTGVP